MNRLLSVFFTGLLYLWVATSYAQSTTIYLVRHAEKDTSVETNQPLTQKGQQRAMQLSRVLKHQPLSAVYSTNTKRTLDTAKPVAGANNLVTTLYQVGELDGSTLTQQHPNSAILIVGHSNTIPKLVNKLVDSPVYKDLDDSEYDSLFIVTLNKSSASHVRLEIPFAPL